MEIQVTDVSALFRASAKSIVRQWPGSRCQINDLLKAMQNDPPHPVTFRTPPDMLAFMLSGDPEITVSSDGEWVDVK